MVGYRNSSPSNGLQVADSLNHDQERWDAENAVLQTTYGSGHKGGATVLLSGFVISW